MNVQPRLMTGAGAAASLGVTPASFTKWVADGRAPKPLPGTRRWDRKAIDFALDKLSGIQPAPISKEDQEEERWIRIYEARKAARFRTSWMRSDELQAGSTFDKPGRIEDYSQWHLE